MAKSRNQGTCFLPAGRLICTNCWPTVCQDGPEPSAPSPVRQEAPRQGADRFRWHNLWEPIFLLGQSVALCGFGAVASKRALNRTETRRIGQTSNSRSAARLGPCLTRFTRGRFLAHPRLCPASPPVSPAQALRTRNGRQDSPSDTASLLSLAPAVVASRRSLSFPLPASAAHFLHRCLAVNCLRIRHFIWYSLFN
jgi:hypothetical protein